MEISRVQGEISRLIQASQAEVSVLWREPGTGCILYSYQPDYQMVSASTIKVPILLAALEQVRRGQLELELPIPVKQAHILADTQVFDLGPRLASLEELLTWMTIASDNTATNVLIDQLGMESVNSYCIRLGLGKTSLARKMLDFEAVRQGRNNYTCAGDIFLLYWKLLEKSILTPALCDKAMEILYKQRAKDLCLRYIWEDVKAAHKTGGLDYLCHDAGLFWFGQNPCFLGIFTQNAPDIEGDRKLVGEIAQLIYRYYRQNG